VSHARRFDVFNGVFLRSTISGEEFDLEKIFATSRLFDMDASII